MPGYHIYKCLCVCVHARLCVCVCFVRKVTVTIIFSQSCMYMPVDNWTHCDCQSYLWSLLSVWHHSVRFSLCACPSISCFTSRESETKMKRGNVQQGKQTAPSELQACPGEWPANVSQHRILLLGKHRQISPCVRLEGFRFCSETDLCPLVNIKSIRLQAALQKHLIQRET